jgi:ATP-dependent DNA ligase
MAGFIEIKLDGFRLLARRDAAGVRLLTRRGIDWTTRYPSIAAAVAALAGQLDLRDDQQMLHESLEEEKQADARCDTTPIIPYACQLGFESIVSKRLGSPYVSGRSRHWIKSKNPAAPAVKREAEEDWGKRWR